MYYRRSRSPAVFEGRSSYGKGFSSYSSDFSPSSVTPRNLSIQRILNSDLGWSERSRSPVRDYSSSRSAVADMSPIRARTEFSPSSMNDTRNILGDGYASRSKNYFEYNSAAGLFPSCSSGTKVLKRTDYSDYLRPVLIPESVIRAEFVPKSRTVRQSAAMPFRRRDTKLVKFREVSGDILSRVRRRISWDIPDEIDSPLINDMRNMSNETNKSLSEHVRSRENSLSRRGSRDIPSPVLGSPRPSISRRSSDDHSLDRLPNQSLIRKSSPRLKKSLISNGVPDVFNSSESDHPPIPPPRKKSFGGNSHKLRQSRKSSIETLLSPGKSANYSVIADDIRRRKRLSGNAEVLGEIGLQLDENIAADGKKRLEPETSESVELSNFVEPVERGRRRRRRRVPVVEQSPQEADPDEVNRRCRSRIRCRALSELSEQTSENVEKEIGNSNDVENEPRLAIRSHRKSVKYKRNALSPCSKMSNSVAEILVSPADVNVGSKFPTLTHSEIIDKEDSKPNIKLSRGDSTSEPNKSVIKELATKESPKNKLATDTKLKLGSEKSLDEKEFEKTDKSLTTDKRRSSNILSGKTLNKETIDKNDSIELKTSEVCLLSKSNCEKTLETNTREGALKSLLTDEKKLNKLDKFNKIQSKHSDIKIADDQKILEPRISTVESKLSNKKTVDSKVGLKTDKSLSIDERRLDKSDIKANITESSISDKKTNDKDKDLETKTSAIGSVKVLDTKIEQKVDKILFDEKKLEKLDSNFIRTQHSISDKKTIDENKNLETKTSAIGSVKVLDTKIEQKVDKILFDEKKSEKLDSKFIRTQHSISDKKTIDENKNLETKTSAIGSVKVLDTKIEQKVDKILLDEKKSEKLDSKFNRTQHSISDKKTVDENKNLESKISISQSNSEPRVKSCETKTQKTDLTASIKSKNAYLENEVHKNEKSGFENFGKNIEYEKMNNIDITAKKTYKSDLREMQGSCTVLNKQNTTEKKEADEIVVVCKLPQPKMTDVLSKSVPVEPKVVVSIVKKSDNDAFIKEQANEIPEFASKSELKSKVTDKTKGNLTDLPDVNVSHTVTLKPKIQKHGIENLDFSENSKGNRLKSIPDVIQSTVRTESKTNANNISDIVESTLKTNFSLEAKASDFNSLTSVTKSVSNEIPKTVTVQRDKMKDNEISQKSSKVDSKRALPSLSNRTSKESTPDLIKTTDICEVKKCETVANQNDFLTNVKSKETHIAEEKAYCVDKSNKLSLASKVPKSIENLSTSTKDANKDINIEINEVVKTEKSISSITKLTSAVDKSNKLSLACKLPNKSIENVSNSAEVVNKDISKEISGDVKTDKSISCVTKLAKHVEPPYALEDKSSMGHKTKIETTKNISPETSFSKKKIEEHTKCEKKASSSVEENERISAPLFKKSTGDTNVDTLKKNSDFVESIDKDSKIGLFSHNVPPTLNKNALLNKEMTKLGNDAINSLKEDKEMNQIKSPKRKEENSTDNTKPLIILACDSHADNKEKISAVAIAQDKCDSKQKAANKLDMSPAKQGKTEITNKITQKPTAESSDSEKKLNKLTNAKCIVFDKNEVDYTKGTKCSSETVSNDNRVEKDDQSTKTDMKLSTESKFALPKVEPNISVTVQSVHDTTKDSKGTVALSLNHSNAVKFVDAAQENEKTKPTAIAEKLSVSAMKLDENNSKLDSPSLPAILNKSKSETNGIKDYKNSTNGDEVENKIQSLTRGSKIPQITSNGSSTTSKIANGGEPVSPTKLPYINDINFDKNTEKLSSLDIGIDKHSQVCSIKGEPEIPLPAVIKINHLKDDASLEKAVPPISKNVESSKSEDKSTSEIKDASKDIKEESRKIDEPSVPVKNRNGNVDDAQQAKSKLTEKFPPIPPPYNRTCLFEKSEALPETILENLSSEESEYESDTDSESSSSVYDGTLPRGMYVPRLFNNFLVGDGPCGEIDENDSTTNDLSPDSNTSQSKNCDIDTPPCKALRFRKYSIDDFVFLKYLGKGSFGKVLLAQLKGTELYFAIKCMRKDRVLTDDNVEGAMIERRVLALGTNHPYLVNMYFTIHTDSYLYYVMEYLSGGDLFFRLQQKRRLNINCVRFYCAEIVCALKFLHKRGIIYRDLKLDNVMIDSQGHIRLVDFGMARLQIYQEEIIEVSFCGTPAYMAPEIISGVKYDQSVDWWALGVLTYEMSVGRSPFFGTTEEELLWSICNEEPDYPKCFLHEQQTQFIAGLLVKEPSERLGMLFCPNGDIKNHGFFRSVDWYDIEKRNMIPPWKPSVKTPYDTCNFDTEFTEYSATLTPLDSTILETIDQEQFKGFSYTNPHIVG